MENRDGIVMEVGTMAGMIISGIIVCVCTGIVVGIGISQMKSKDPVGFYTGEKPPKREQVSNVASWNKKHGMMWVVYGICLLAAWICSALIGNNYYALVPFAIGIFVPMVIMIFYHQKLVKEYLFR